MFVNVDLNYSCFILLRNHNQALKLGKATMVFPVILVSKRYAKAKGLPVLQK